MPDNVTPISQHPRWPSAAEDESGQKNRHANEQERRKREERRLYEIEEVPLLRWKGDNDSVLAARAIHELKEKLPRGGGEEIKRKFPGIRIDRFSISPDGVDPSTNKLLNSEGEKAKAQLVRPYLKVAEAIAEVGGFSPVDCKLRVLRDTERWKPVEAESSVSDENSLLLPETAQHLAFLIKETVGRIQQDTDLAELFSRMRRVPGQWDISTETFKGTTSMACLFQTAYCEWFEYWGETPPLPSLPLVRFWQAEWSLPEESILVDGPEENSSASLATNPSAKIHLYREIRLAIGPTVNAETIGPLFETRPQFELKVIAGTEEFATTLELPDVLLKSSTEPFRLQIGATTYRVQKPANLSDLTYEVLWDCTPISTDKQCVESHYISWTPVDAAHVSHWLGRDDAEISDFLAHHQNRSSRLCVWGVPAHQFLSTIEKHALKAALESEIEKIKTAFETYETEWREYLQERTAKLAAELDADQSPSS